MNSEAAREPTAREPEVTEEAQPAEMPQPRIKQRRGFAAMNKDAHRELARSGGVAAHAMGLAHQFTSELAREAGRKGGVTTAANREHMAAIGRKGGLGKRGFRKELSDAE